MDKISQGGAAFSDPGIVVEQFRRLEKRFNVHRPKSDAQGLQMIQPLPPQL